jgi:hypothetical protein
MNSNLVRILQGAASNAFNFSFPQKAGKKRPPSPSVSFFKERKQLVGDPQAKLLPMTGVYVFQVQLMPKLFRKNFLVY